MAAPVLAGTTGASTEAAPPWTVNGPVDSLLASGHTLYVGGKFSQLAPRSGPLVAVSATTGARVGAFPAASDGAVRAVLADGKGGWFVGGTFDALGGVGCRYLAHVTAAMAVDRRFCPRPDDSVLALASDGSTLYAGGVFSRVGTARRSFLAALSATTGRPVAWVPPAIDDAVTGLATRNGVLYLLGDFGAVGGKIRFSLAAVDIRTRRVTRWDPRAPTSGDHGDTSTQSIAAGPDTIYVGGIFDHIGGKKVAGLAALDPVTGRATGFVPSGKPWSVDALTVAGGRLYAGGITHTGGYLAAYDAATGRPEWQRAGDPVQALGVGGARLFVGGNKLQAVDAATGHRVAWSPPPPNLPVQALAAFGKTVVMGGEFTGVGGVFRDGLAALDLATGRPTNWSPSLSSSERPQPEVDAMALSGPTLYVGGDFTSAGGRHRTDVAALSTATGAANGWAPEIKADQVLAVALGGSNVYLGGFDSASSYDTAGTLRWNSPPSAIDASVNAIAVAGGTVYLGGSFDVIGGANRHALVAVDAGNGSTTSWDPRISEPDATEEVDSLVLSGTTLYVGGGFDSAGGTKRKNLAAFDVRTGKLTSWAPKAGDDVHVYTLAATATAVYAAGDGGAEAFAPKSGATLGWHPGLSAGGGFPTPFVHAIAVAGSTVYVGDEAGLEAFSR